MANVRNSNTWYIDTAASTLAIPNIRVTHIVFTATSNNASLILQDVTTGATKIRLDISSSTDYRSDVFDFSDNPLIFPNGINPSTVTSCVATLVLRETRA